MNIDKTWADFKQTVSDKQLDTQYKDMGDNPSKYMLWAPDGFDVYMTSLVKNTTEAADFEDNFKALCNKKIRVRTDDRKFTLRTIKSDVDVDLPDDNWVEIFSVDGRGMPVYLWIEFYSGNYEIRLTMDGSVAFQMNNLEVSTYDLGDRNQVGYVGGAPYRRSSDLFCWHFPDDIYYKTNFRLDARRRTGNNRGIDRFLFIHKEELV